VYEISVLLPIKPTFTRTESIILLMLIIVFVHHTDILFATLPTVQSKSKFRPIFIPFLKYFRSFPYIPVPIWVFNTGYSVSQHRISIRVSPFTVGTLKGILIRTTSPARIKLLTTKPSPSFFFKRTQVSLLRSSSLVFLLCHTPMPSL